MVTIPIASVAQTIRIDRGGPGLRADRRGRNAHQRPQTTPIAKARRVPVIGPFTGAGFLRAPDLPNVVNIRASYRAEAEEWIKQPDGRSSPEEYCDLLPGRFLRARRSGWRQARAGKARLGINGRRNIRAQYQSGWFSIAHAQTRRTGSGRHGRHIRTMRGVHQAGAQERL